MIIVIADDFSGAAEIAGIGLRFGLSVEVQTNFDAKSFSDLVIIDSNTRSVDQAEAGSRIKLIAGELKKLEIEWIYKKIDSLLRGHIITEAKAILDIIAQKNILLIPANPGMGRTISKGKYYIDGVPIHKTDFLMDPNFPRRSENVLEMLDLTGGDRIRILNPKDEHQIENIVIGEAKYIQDLETWASRLKSQIIPAGGSEFFAAILQSKGFEITKMHIDLLSLSNSKKFMVCGSPFPENSHFLQDLRDNFSEIVMVPCKINTINQGVIKKCQATIINAFHKSNFVLLFMDYKLERIFNREEALTMFLADITAGTLNAIPISELIIEGGDTASVIVRKMQWERLIPRREWSPGVVRMGISDRPNFYLTTKPGSYPWPKELIHSWMNWENC